MRNDVESFDRELQMFRETCGPVNLPCLRFLRWLAEQGRLEHPAAGPPSGPFVESLDLLNRLDVLDVRLS
jgi:hypothetical protein